MTAPTYRRYLRVYPRVTVMRDPDEGDYEVRERSAYPALLGRVFRDTAAPQASKPWYARAGHGASLGWYRTLHDAVVAIVTDAEARGEIGP